MEKLIDYLEFALMFFLILIAIVAIVAGIMLDMWYSIVMGMLCMALVYVWYNEEMKHKE